MEQNRNRVDQYELRESVSIQLLGFDFSDFYSGWLQKLDGEQTIVKKIVE